MTWVSREYPLIDDGRRATQLRPSSTDQPAGQSKGSNQYIFGEKLKDNLEQYNLEIQPTYLEKNNWEQPILGNPINIYLGEMQKNIWGHTTSRKFRISRKYAFAVRFSRIIFV